MHKTTIYLNEREISQLRLRATKRQRISIASLIRQAIQSFLKESPKKESFSFLKNQIRKRPSKTPFGDAVSYQRSVRREWR